MQKPVDKEGLR